MDKYYTPKIEEFHVGFEYDLKPRVRNGIYAFINEKHEYLDRWEIDIFCDDKTWDELITRTFDAPRSIPDVKSYLKDKAIRVKYLDREDIEGVLNKRYYDTGKKWRYGREMIKGDSPKEYPWIEFILEDASTIIINEYLQKILIQKTFPSGRGSAMVFNGVVKNKSEFIKILKQVEL